MLKRSNFGVRCPRAELPSPENSIANLPDNVAQSAKLSDQKHLAAHDRHDRYEFPTTPSPSQRQQRPIPRTLTPQTPNRQDSATPSSHRVLRRTPRFETPSPRAQQQQQARQTHLEAVTVGLGPRLPLVTAGPDDENPRPRTRPARQLSQDLSDDVEEESSAQPSHRASAYNEDRSEPHPAVRISKHTHNAILYTLEEALRHPSEFTPDLEEENAQMADLLHGGTSNGNGATPTRPTAAPQPTGSPGIRGPRMIMRERQEREARRAEQERMQRDREREREQLEKQQMEEARRRDAERQAYAAGAATGAGEPSQRRQTVSESQGRQPRQTSTSQGAMPASLRTRANTAGDGYSSGQQPAQTGEPSRTSNVTSGRSSFPHAFERWEALSAHWEGLTSFWIRKLEQNASEIERDPVSTQLSRQVTDLSAAGANLFHAVVELQRLRASSERKFQRWFFETRSEIERHQENSGMLQQALEQERAGRDSRIQAALQTERESSKTQKQLSEMKKELAISKDEARRAWDELGRREQEERDRVQNLQSGLPVVIGGVQVVPMTQGVPSRHGSQRDPSRADYPEYSQAQAPPSTSAPGGQGYYPQGAEGSEGGHSEEGYDDPASFPPQSAAYTTAPDYSGQGYGGTWDAPRHHHPTRLSDVPEEDDERSRTSASALSRGNN
ncbi:hypothetical protein MKZ38_000833 [Zalerion maritima]|uniref:Uncharacterized protein n=1 Tax=Zalerion maritima TaxID=339359 RepID=A0AAD5WRU2_9PEZI|nr:hypothetical protein MKZ38_000833 [Zalerion maritima]